MGQSQQISSLQAKHAELEDAIDTENSRPHPDDIVIAELKKQKLRLKDELARLVEA